VPYPPYKAELAGVLTGFTSYVQAELDRSLFQARILQKTLHGG
jgi:hypothetical protein